MSPLHSIGIKLGTTYEATNTPKTNAKTRKSMRCRTVMYVDRFLGSRPAMARTKLQKVGLSCAAASVGGVGGASFTKNMSGVTALDMIPSTRI